MKRIKPNSITLNRRPTYVFFTCHPKQVANGNIRGPCEGRRQVAHSIATWILQKHLDPACNVKHLCVQIWGQIRLINWIRGMISSFQEQCQRRVTKM